MHALGRWLHPCRTVSESLLGCGGNQRGKAGGSGSTGLRCPLATITILRTRSVLNWEFFFLQTLECLHIHNEISWGGALSLTMFICVSYTPYTHSPKVTLHSILNNHQIKFLGMKFAIGGAISRLKCFRFGTCRVRTD